MELLHTDTINCGMNKGNERIWREWNRTDQVYHGIYEGMRYNKLFVDNTLVIKFDDNGKSKINGTSERAILDLNGKYLHKLGFRKGDQVKIEYYRDSLITNDRCSNIGTTQLTITKLVA